MGRSFVECLPFYSCVPCFLKKHGKFQFLCLPCIQLREALLKGKVWYGWPPCINLFRWARFHIEDIIYILYKTSYLNEEVSCTTLSLPLRLVSPIQRNLYIAKLYYSKHVCGEKFLWSVQFFKYVCTCSYFLLKQKYSIWKIKIMKWTKFEL